MLCKTVPVKNISRQEKPNFSEHWATCCERMEFNSKDSACLAPNTIIEKLRLKLEEIAQKKAVAESVKIVMSKKTHVFVTQYNLVLKLFLLHKAMKIFEKK